jgi:hypothetical protein
MTGDLYPRRWSIATAIALLFTVALLLVPQHGHAFLLFAALVPTLWFFSVVVTQEQHEFVNEQSLPLDPLLKLPSLSHLPPSSTLA